MIASKVTLSATWAVLSDEEISGLLKSIEEKSFVLEYPDARLGKRVMTEVYVNSRTAPMYCYDKGEEGQEDSWKWQGLSISFMEV